MPQWFDENAPTAKTVEQLRLEKIEKEIAAKRKSDREYRKAWKSLRKVKIENLPVRVGNQVDEKKDLRKDARQKMRFDKDVSTHAYAVNENSPYWYENVEMTLAVITHAKMIIASRQKRSHDVYEHTHPTEIRRVEHKPERSE